MRKFLLSLPVKYQILFVIGTTIVLAFVIAIACSFFFDITKLAANTELTSAIYQVMGTIYAILLTFTLWGVWQKYCDAETSVQSEAYALLNLVHIAESCPKWHELNIRSAILGYAKSVLEQEWPTFRKSADAAVNISQYSYKASLHVIRTIQSIAPQGAREAVVFDQTLTLLSDWLNARRTRILLSKGNSAEALWPLLLTGAFVLFAFHGLFVARTAEIWATLLFGFALVIGLTFYLIFTLDSPFAGTTSIDAQPFELAVTILSTELH